jgi:tRNA A-37 threonylcarbamoyl transferase component Bud32/tetratricopeptide (TPR) repeat protein
MMELDDGLLVALAGRYDIEREIGQGGMAVVYLARDVKLNRRVALKVLRPELANSLGNERFLQEISIAAPLMHPNILAIHDSGEAAGHLYYVMPYVDGLTLRQRLDRERQLPIDEAVAIVKQVAAALDFAHARGVVHRDIKPENILLLGEHVLVADFGLAKAISRAASQPLTQSGMVVGTPAYMSPEQAIPGEALDARSDIYSLACVLFEMIAGMPPYRGATPQAVLAHHVASAPPALCEERRSCPPYVDEAVRRAMAKIPADRFSSAQLFARALQGPMATPASPTSGVVTVPGAPTVVTAPAVRRGRIIGVSALAAVAVLVLGWAFTRGPLRREPALDPSTYAVFPFRHAPGVKSVWLDGDACARKLQDAMARWTDVRLVDDMRVSDLWARKAPRTVSEALDAARGLSAGRLAWGEVVPAGDSLEIRAVAYEVSNPSQPTRQFVVRVGQSAGSLDSGFMALADSIILGGGRSRDNAAPGTKSLRAWEQYDEGRRALDRFDLKEAEQRFRDAIAIDEGYAHPHLWLARTLSWGAEAAPAEWLGDASRAVALSTALPPRDASHASALLKLAEGKMSEACRQYRALLATDSLDFAAWFGLGDCNARDSVVVPDPHSPTRYSFRGSLYTAFVAYQRALALVPSYHLAERGSAFRRLSRRVLYTEPSRSRRGVGIPPDTQTYIAFPSFAADTIAFVPTPYRSVAGALAGGPTEREAVRWSAEQYRGLMADWVRAFPRSADAQEGSSLALEASSAISGETSSLTGALQAARRAVVGSASDDLRVKRSAAVVRLLLKLDSLEAARSLVDSLLRTVRSPSANQAGYLAALATLTGRARVAASLAAQAARDSAHMPFASATGRRADFPVPVSASAMELRVYASLGGPRDSLRAALLRTNRLIDLWLPPSARADARQALLRNSFALAYDALAANASFIPSAGRDPLLAMRVALAAGDTAAARVASNELASLTTRSPPGSMGTDRLYHHAAILLALRDTTVAIERLDAALAALPRVRSIITEVPPQAGAVGRAMILRAQLAKAQGDRATAERWTRSAFTLWRNADAELRAPLDGLLRELGLH